MKLKLPKITPAHVYNQQVHQDAVADEESQMAQHRALMKMAAGTPPPPAVPPPAPAIAPSAPPTSFKPAATAPMAPIMPGAPAKGQFFPGIASALRKKKIGL